MLKLGEWILELLLKLFGSYTDKHAEAQVAAEESHENDIANQPRNDDDLAKRLRSYEDHTF